MTTKPKSKISPRLRIYGFQKNYGHANSAGELTGQILPKGSTEGLCVTSVSFFVGTHWKYLWCRSKTGKLRALSDTDIQRFWNLLRISPELLVDQFEAFDCITVSD